MPLVAAISCAQLGCRQICDTHFRKLQLHIFRQQILTSPSIQVFSQMNKGASRQMKMKKINDGMSQLTQEIVTLNLISIERENESNEERQSAHLHRVQSAHLSVYSMNSLSYRLLHFSLFQ